MYKGVKVIVLVLVLFSLIAGCVSLSSKAEVKAAKKQESTISCVQVNDNLIECGGTIFSK